MKHYLPILALGTTLFLGARAASAQMGNSGPGDTPIGLFGHTPVPASAKTTGPKKPLEGSLAKDEKGGRAGMTFAKADTKIYLLCKDVSGVKGDKVRVVWIAEETGGAFPKNKTLNDFTQTLSGPGQATSFFATVPGGFPVGKYHADLYDGATLVKTLKFTVK